MVASEEDFVKTSEDAEDGRMPEDGLVERGVESCFAGDIMPERIGVEWPAHTHTQI